MKGKGRTGRLADEAERVLAAVLFSSQPLAKEDKTKIAMSRLDKKGIPARTGTSTTTGQEQAALTGRNLREDWPSRDKPCESLQTGQQAGRGGRVGHITSQDQQQHWQEAGWGLAALAGPGRPGRDQNSVRVFVSGWAGRLLLASPASHRPGFACARAS